MYKKIMAFILVVLLSISISSVIAAVSPKQGELTEATHINIRPPMEEVRGEETNAMLNESRKVALTKLKDIEGIEIDRWTMIDLLDSDIYYTNDLPSREAGSFNKLL